MIGVLSSAQNNSGATPAPSFTPAELFSNGEDGAWYDPSDLSTLWKDTAGTTPVTTDGDLVARIDDKSGNGYHLTQASSGNRPSYRTDGTHNWLSFDGASDLESAAPIGSFSSSFTAIWTIKSSIDNSVRGVWSTRLASDQDRITGYCDTRDSPKRIWFVDEGLPDIYVDLPEELDLGTHTLTAFKDGSTNGGSANGESAASVNHAGIGENSGFVLGSQRLGSLYFNGILYGLIVRDLMTSQEQSDAENWLMGKT